MFIKLLSIGLFAPLFTLINDKSPTTQGDYEIMIYEVNNEEYCTFLNCVGKTNDNYFSPIMNEHFMGGITKNVTDDGTFNYGIIPGFENKPVIGVSWQNAIRFINWLHYNSANIENHNCLESFVPYTEGDSHFGAYDTTKPIPTRNKQALYWLPNKLEWEKAAFYDGENWHQDTIYEGSNCYSTTDGWKYSFPHITDIGVASKPSFYGTYDQQGNLAEWVEDGKEQIKYVLGGSLIRPTSYAKYGAQEGDFTDKSIASFGFRVCRTSNQTNRQNEAILPSDCDMINVIAQTVIRNNVSQRNDPNDGVYVLVGEEGNFGDVVNRFKGRVNYPFYISKYELTNDEYCKFLNATAKYSDPYNLYDPNMSTGISGGIIKVINDNNEAVYIVKSGFERKPVTYIGFYELARYANWLHFGCPVGEQLIGITEGNSSIGAYDTSEFEDVRYGHTKPTPKFGKRNKGALYWIPNEDEWYKAAYYDPEKIGNRKYHDYPTRTSDAPDSKSANYMIDNTFAIGKPYFIADVDAFENASSYFGTQQQGGNVWEWTESWQYGIPGQRALRGGSWQYTEWGLNSVNEDPGGINDKSYLFGGRLCKAVSPNGYSEVKKPISYDFYVWVHNLPLKHLFYGTIAIVSGFFLIICFLLFLIFRKRRNKVRDDKKIPAQNPDKISDH